jgi:hypothetical protein
MTYKKSARVRSGLASSTPATPQTSGRSMTTEFNPDYSQTVRDLKRIGLLAGSLFAILIVLSFVLPYVIR